MEETISLKEIVEVIKKRLVLIIGLIVGAAVIAAIVSYFILTPTYESSSMFVVNQEQQESGQYNVNEIRSNVELINTYNVIIKSPAILEDVVQELNLSYSADQLSNKINVSSAENSQVVTVTATDPDAELAANIANTTVTTFQQKIPDLLNVDNVHILSEAELTANPEQVSPKPLLNIAIAIVLGAMVGIGIAFLLEYLDNTIKTEDDVEKRMGVPVLGVVTHVSDDDVRLEHFQTPHSRRRGGLDGTQKKSI
ncbi:YveK family protein [Virgibacillus sp. JSM 102003]|uniref:YveK family protein n=1 Tax=Virgibacillus sp. JSM 102003 TaxID=1562108 RepID=UPI0035C11DF2